MPTEPVNPFSLLKLVLLVIATIFGAYRGIQDLSVALGEPEPAAFDAQTLHERYEGQQWVAVSGRAALEFMVVRPSTHSAHADKDLAYIQVPIVGEDWSPSEPVYVVATYGPIPRAEGDRWQPPELELTVTGELRTAPLPDADAMFPALELGTPLIVINEGTQPDAKASIFFLAIMFVAGGLGVSVLTQIVRERRASASAPAS